MPDYFENYTWNTSSIESAIVVDKPGMYWIEAKDGECTIRGTIVIDELPFNCDCPVFIPNVFSPNGDGVNDELVPQTPCAFDQYNLSIFNRWGQTVFVSSDPSESWDGDGKRNFAESGFVYLSAYISVLLSRHTRDDFREYYVAQVERRESLLFTNPNQVIFSPY